MVDSGILATVDDSIDEALGLKDGRKYHHPKTCQNFSAGQEPILDVGGLIQNMLIKIQKNWHKGKRRSDENWRLGKKNTAIGKKNTSHETILERWIVRTTGPEWVNQVPVASGVARNGGTRLAIDLVHQTDVGRYEFIELKVDEHAGTPLFAAMEILKYGVLYIFSRENAAALGYEVGAGLLGAKQISLKVLAASSYYDNYDLRWLEIAVNRGLHAFLSQHAYGFTMDFKFESFALVPACSPAVWGARG
jgi:hypothetical protein